MARFRDVNRTQQFLLPPDMGEWVPEDDLVHFVIEAAERVEISAFKVNWRGTGSEQYHPRMMLALLVYCYANGIFSSRRIERATHRDIGVRFVAANTHPDHDTIAKFRRDNAEAFATAFLEILLLAKELKLLRLGMVSTDGTKLDANASKHQSLRYDRAKELRAQLESDIADLMAQAEAADAADGDDPQALPEEIARREKLKAKMDAACARLEAQAKARAAAERAEYEAKLKAYEERGGKGRKPTPPKETPDDDEQTNLTDPDSRIMRKNKRSEYRQAYNAQATVDADGTQLILSAGVSQSASDAGELVNGIDAIPKELGRPETVLADTGFADEHEVAELGARGIDVLVAIGAETGQRTYDFRPPKEPRPPPETQAQWRKDMKAKLETEAGKAKYRKRKHTVEPVFGIIKSVLGFRHFHLRGFGNVKCEWQLVALAYNLKRLHNMVLAEAAAAA
jgi:transposase